MHRRLALGLFSMSLILFGCVHSQPTAESPFYPSADESRQRNDYIRESNNAMVVTAHPAASRAGLSMLQQNGNAVDAAVAASFALAVVRPHSTGIGGGGFLLLHNPETRQTRALDFRERAPLKANRTMYLDAKGQPTDFRYGDTTVENASLNGHLAAGVPGLVAGLLALHHEQGRLPLAVVMAPAIELAEKGFPVYPALASALERRKQVLATFPATRAIFFRDKKTPLKTGDTLKQKDLAWTLQQIARDGAKAFYEGAIAQKIVAEMQRAGGLISLEDLKRYQPIERKPVANRFLDFEILAMPPPSSGGVHIAQMLNILAGYELNEMGWKSASFQNLLIEAMRHAYADRAKYLGDPDFVDVPVSGLTSKAYAAKIRNRLAVGRAGDSDQVGAGNPLPYESASTTHFSIVDPQGMIVTSTQTINYSMGSGAVVPGTGIVLNNEMDDFAKKPGVPNAYGLLGSEANQIEPGKTMLSSMTPALVMRDGRPVLALGSPGGSRIITAVLQVILNRCAFRMPLADAVHAYRLHHQWRPDKVYIESLDYAPTSFRRLEAMGYNLEPTSFPIGDIQAISFENGKIIGVSDTRGEGKPLGF